MYNPDKLEEYAQKIYSRYEYFNNYTLETIARRIKATGRLSAADQQALKNIADITGDMDAITKKLAEITRMSIADIEKIYTQVLKDGVNTYKPLYDFKGMQFVPFEQNDFAQQLVRNWAIQTAETMLNLSRTKALCFDKTDIYGNVTGSTPLAGAFENIISEAVQAVSSGTTDFNTAMSKTVERLGGSGVKVKYESGVNRSLSAMIRQNILYGAKQSAQAYDEYIGAKLGCDGFEVDAHAGCRPSHEFMQGKMYSYKGEKTVDGVTYADGAEALKALGDYGCLHFKTDVILGVSVPTYSDEDLEQIHKETTELIEYNGRKKTLYEWKQTQRTFERNIRTEQQKANTFEAAGMHRKAADCKSKVKTYRKVYDDMCNKISGIEAHPERMRVYKDAVDNFGKSGIIDIGCNEMYRKAKDNYITPMPKKQLHKIEKAFKRQGGVILRNQETDEYLSSKNAEAITYDAHTILLKSNPGRASVFEELIHATQYKTGENDGSYISRLKCEISAQEKLLLNSKQYQLTDKEVEQTKNALTAYRNELKNFKKGGN